MTMWSSRRNAQGEDGIFLIRAKKLEQIREESEKGAVDIDGYTIYKEVMMYFGSVSFLASSMLWCGVHSLELSFPEEKIRFIKRSLILVATGVLVCAYVAGMAHTVIALEKKKNTEKEIETIKSRLMAKIEPTLFFLEALSCITLACMSMRYVLNGEKTPDFFPIIGCVGSFLSIASSSICIYRTRFGKSDTEAKHGNMKMRVSFRLLSILLSSTNICLCITSLSPSVNVEDRLRTSIQLAVSIGWVIAFAGAIMLTRSSQLSRQNKLGGGGGIEISSALYDMNGGICGVADEISPPCISP